MAGDQCQPFLRPHPVVFSSVLTTHVMLRYILYLWHHSSYELNFGMNILPSSCYTSKEFRAPPISGMDGARGRVDCVQKLPFYASLWRLTTRDRTFAIASYIGSVKYKCTLKYLTACSQHFEQGFLSHKRVSTKEQEVIVNRFCFFSEWLQSIIDEGNLAQLCNDVMM